MLVLNLLGPTQLIRDYEQIADLPVGKNLALLAYLALEPRPHGRERLAALLWSDMPAARAQSNLRMALYTLNQQLPGLLISTRSTVALAREQPVAVDVLQFSACAADLQADMPQLAATIALWRGELLGDLALSGAALFDEWLSLFRERMRQDLFILIERFSQACLRSGTPHEAIPALQRWLQIEPWSETAHRTLMTALARSGRYTEALAQYEACSAILHRELAVPPMPETRILAEQIQQARTLAPRDNLPLLRTPLVGRDSETTTLLQHLLDPATRLLTISGMGGMGKSRLALHSATQLRHAFLHGVWFVALDNCTEPLALAATVAAALNLPLGGGNAPEAVVLQALKARELLLVLDGFEALLSAAPQLSTWLDAAPGLKLLITSRQRIGVRGEIVLALEGLPADAAAALFCGCVQRINPTYDLASQRGQIAALCQLTGGMPLALELAAAWTERSDLATIVTQVIRDSEALSGAYRDLPANQASLRAIVAFSWSQLPPAAQTMLAQLAVFRGSFSSVQAQMLCAADQTTLTLLTHHALLHTPEPQRYAMHAMVHQFARDQLAADPHGEQQAHRKHLALFGDLLHEQNKRLSGGEQTLAALSTLATDSENLRAAWSYALALPDQQWLARAAEPLHKFYEGQGRYIEGEALFSQAVAHTDGELRSRLRVHHAALLVRLGRVPDALAAAEAARAELPPDRIGFAMNLLGILYAASGRNSAALHAYTACMQAYRDAGDLRQLVKPLANVGPLLLRMGDITAAQDALMEGLELAKQIGDQRGESHFLNNLGIAAFQQGNYRAAAEYYQACADLCAQINHDSVRLVALYNLAEIALLTDRTAEAHTLAQQAALLAEQFGDRRNQALALRILGMACLATDPDRALAHLTHARELARATQSPPILLDVAYGWAHLYLDRGEHTAAHALLAMIANHPASEGYLLRQVEAYTSLRDLPPCSADAASTQLETFAQG